MKPLGFVSSSPYRCAIYMGKKPVVCVCPLQAELCSGLHSYLDLLVAFSSDPQLRLRLSTLAATMLIFDGER